MRAVIPSSQQTQVPPLRSGCKGLKLESALVATGTIGGVPLCGTLGLIRVRNYPVAHHRSQIAACCDKLTKCASCRSEGVELL